MGTSVLVTGGTGTLGRLVVPALRASGCEVRVLSRSGAAGTVAGDLLTGDGVERAVAGAEIVVHLAGGPKGDDVATRNLVVAAAKAQVQHLVYISVIGADGVPLAWLRSKLAAEQAIATSGIPSTTLRAAQFHTLVHTMLEKLTALPVVPVPGGLRMQPVDPADVAARVVELALGRPTGRVPDIAGPVVHSMDELVRGFLAARGRRRLLLPIRMPGKVGRAYRAGANLTLEGATLGERTWESFLAQRQHETAQPG
ncbi:SDR family oxidoreductase [Pseudonocardia sp. TRM90224]|uniref:SDR family oxidoreductase n=1 Tax=Pseudonocardia sp. TRM90224 TaxID=2812678 RepID=UPI001E421A06|nr:NAD(P)H-binding protein [Pseudonocardia sp. TRM90224]